MKPLSLGIVLSLFLSSALVADIPDHLNVKKAKAELDAAQFEVDQKQIQYDAKVDALRRARQHLRNKENALSDAIDRADRLKDRLDGLDNEVANINERLPKIKRKIDSLVGDVDDARRERNQAHKRWENRKAELQPIQDRLDKLNRKIKSLQDSIRPKKNQLDRAKTALSQAQRDRKSLVSQRDSLTQKIQNKRSEVASLKTKIKNQSDRLAKLRAKNKQLLQDRRAAHKVVLDWNDKIKKINAQIDKAKANGNKAKVKRLVEKRKPMLQKRKAAVAKRDRIISEHEASKAKQKSVKANMDRNVQKRDRLNNQIAKHVNDRKSINNQIGSLDTRIASLKTQIANLQSEIGPAMAEIKKLVRRRDGVRTELANKKTEVQRAWNVYSQKNTTFENLKAELQNLRQKRKNLVARRDQLQSERPDLAQRLQRARRRAKNLREEVRLAKEDVREAVTERDLAENALDFAKTEAQKALGWYNTVVANYNRERNQVISMARSEATQDASLDATGQAAVDGAAAGEISGRDVGSAEGLAEGQERDYARGYRDGRAKAELPGNEGAYKGGLTRGRALASDKARAEDFPKGYNQALEALLGAAPASSATVSLLDGISEDPGGKGELLTGKPRPIGFIKGPKFPMLQDPSYDVPDPIDPSITVPGSNKNNYEEPCDNLILDEFIPLCRRSYSNKYDAVFDDVYEEKYEPAFDSGFNSTVQGAYDAALAKTHPAQTKAGFDQGVVQEGILDGFTAALPGARIQAHADGEKRLAVDMAKGHLIRFVDAKLRDGNGDGLLTPGEAVYLDITIDNYGKLASPLRGMKVLVDSVEGIEELETSERELPALAAETRTTLTHVLGSEILPLAAGSEISVEGRVQVLRNGSMVELANFEIEGTTQFPLELTKISVPQKAGVNQEVPARFLFVNRTSETIRNAEVKITTTPKFVEVIDGEVEIPTLTSGSSYEVKAKIKPGPWVGGNEKVTFSTQVLGIPGIEKSRQNFFKTISITRNASLHLFDLNNNPISGRLKVKAGSRLRFNALFKFHATQWKRGPFKVKAARTSDPALKNSSNSTVGIDYGSWHPSTKASPWRLSYDVPRSLKGKEAWIMLTLNEGGNLIHAPMIYLDVE